MLNDILIALGVVGVISVILGILLALFVNLFGIKEDEKAKNIRAVLPGINCGACGFKGCDDYAAALAQGNAKPNLCVPGAADTSNAIGELLGIEVEPPKDVVAFVHCNGNCDATSKKAVYDGITSCKAAAMLYGGPEACHYGCLGFGDCAASCPVQAICMRDGIAHVDFTRCIGCGICAANCPKHVIALVPRSAAAAVLCSSLEKGAVAGKKCEGACLGCKKCEKACPNGAVTVQNNLAVLDYDKCTGCGLCAQACPTGCLKHVELLHG